LSTPPIQPVPSKLDNILAIINVALGMLAQIPALALPIAVEQGFQRILESALAAYTQETGKAFDVTNIPLEKPVE
jgi:hypothetical protein